MPVGHGHTAATLTLTSTCHNLAAGVDRAAVAVYLNVQAFMFTVTPLSTSRSGIEAKTPCTWEST
jgi:hypothetical protein